MGEHDVADRFVGDAADAGDHVGGHDGRCLGVGHQYAIIADHDAGVGVALGGVGPGVLRELREAHVLGLEVGMRGEFLAHACLLLRCLDGLKAQCAPCRGD